MGPSNTNDQPQPGATPGTVNAPANVATPPVTEPTAAEVKAATEPSDTAQDLTFGQTAVGLNFNPSNDPLVQRIKSGFAALIDILHVEREASSDPGTKRHYSVAITDLETAQMRAVKAATWGK